MTVCLDRKLSGAAHNARERKGKKLSSHLLEEKRYECHRKKAGLKSCWKPCPRGPACWAWSHRKTRGSFSGAELNWGRGVWGQPDCTWPVSGTIQWGISKVEASCPTKGRRAEIFRDCPLLRAQVEKNSLCLLSLNLSSLLWPWESPKQVGWGGK